MSNIERNNESLPILINRGDEQIVTIPRLSATTLIRNYFESEDSSGVENNGYIDAIKSEGIV